MSKGVDCNISKNTRETLLFRRTGGDGLWHAVLVKGFLNDVCHTKNMIPIQLMSDQSMLEMYMLTSNLSGNNTCCVTVL